MTDLSYYSLAEKQYMNKSKDTQTYFSSAQTYIFIIVVLQFYLRSTHPLFADVAIV